MPVTLVLMGREGQLLTLPWPAHLAERASLQISEGPSLGNRMGMKQEDASSLALASAHAFMVRHTHTLMCMYNILTARMHIPGTRINSSRVREGIWKSLIIFTHNTHTHTTYTQHKTHTHTIHTQHNTHTYTQHTHILIAVG